MNVQGVISASNQTISSDLTLRVRLRAELSQIEEHLRASPDLDELKSELLEWVRLFKEALRVNGQDQETLVAFKAALQELLKDPFLQQPLRENALLGSDGYTYDPVILDRYRRVVAEEYRNRSPFHPDDSAPFTTKVNPYVGRMLRWLASHSEGVNPYHRRERLRRIVQQEEPNQDFVNQMLSYAADRYGEVRRESQAGRAQFARQVEQQRTQDHEHQARLNQEIATLEEECRVLEEESAQIERRLADTGESISQIDRDRLRISGILKDVEKAGKKRKHRFLTDLLKCVAIVGVCLFATWAINGALGAMGGQTAGSAYLAPTKGGGAGINLMVRF